MRPTSYTNIPLRAVLCLLGCNLLSDALSAQCSNPTQVPNQTISSGSSSYSDSNALSAGNVTVNGSGSLTMVAGNCIQLLPNFHAASGTAPTTFHAWADALPSAISVAPSSGSGLSQSFTWTASSPSGYSNLSDVYALFNTSLTAYHGCMIYYKANSNLLYVFDDSYDLLGGFVPGSSGTASNSYCTISGSSVSGSGTQLALTLTVTFQPGILIGFNNYLYADDQSGMNSEWQPVGTWTPQSSSPITPTSLSIPVGGNGVTFSANFNVGSWTLSPSYNPPSSSGGFGFTTVNTVGYNPPSTLPNTTQVTLTATGLLGSASIPITLLGSGSTRSVSLPATSGAGSLNVSGTASSNAPWLPITSQGGGTANYSYTANTATTPRSAAITDSSGPANVTQAGSAGSSPLTITTQPTGLALTVDGQACQNPCSPSAGSSHTIAVANPQTIGQHTYYFSYWSDSGAQSHSVSTSGVYTAFFSTDDPVGALQGCISNTNGTTSVPAFCQIPAGACTQTAPCSITQSIAVTRSNVIIQGTADARTDPTKATVLARGTDLAESLVWIGRDQNGWSTSPVTGVTIQNLSFCGGSSQRTDTNGNPPNPKTPCLNTVVASCEASQNCEPDFRIYHTGPGQTWSQGPSNPFNNTGPYNVTIAYCTFDDAPGPSRHPIFIAPQLIGQVVNDVYIHDNVTFGSIQMGAYNTTINWGDNTQCDNWPARNTGIAYADDTTLENALPLVTIPRNIRFLNNTFRLGSVGGDARYVAVDTNSIYDLDWPTRTGGDSGGILEQEWCADQVRITNNTMQGAPPQLDASDNLILVSGMELYSRNLTVSGNTVSGFADEAIGLLSVNNATVTNNHLYNNSAWGAGDPDIKIATRSLFPGGIWCSPEGWLCNAMRDANQITVQGNDRSGGPSISGYYGIYFDATLDGSTDNILINSVNSNFAGETDQGGEVAYNQHVTVDTSKISPANGTPIPVPDSSPHTIFVFPAGDSPLGVYSPNNSSQLMGTQCQAFNNATPPLCTSYSNRGTFRFGANDPGGPYNISTLEVILSTGTNSGTLQNGNPPQPAQSPGQDGPFFNAPFCHFLYSPPTAPGASGTIQLDQNTIWTQSGQDVANWSDNSDIGSGQPLSNSACAIYPTTSSYALLDGKPASDSTAKGFFLYLDIGFANNGVYYMYEQATNQQGVQNGNNDSNLLPYWSLWGYWAVGPVPGR